MGYIYKIYIRCCVCRKIIGWKLTDKKENDGLFSDTYCSKCYDVVLSEIEAYKK